MRAASNTLLKLLGILLLVTAVLKGLQLLTEPVGNTDIWTYRPFLILTVEFELALGTWLLLFYHHGCRDCAAAISKYEQIARDLRGNENFLRIAFVGVPAYGQRPVSINSACLLGRLAEVKEWFITSPAVVLTYASTVKATWEQAAPDFETVVRQMSKTDKNNAKESGLRINRNTNRSAIKKEGVNYDRNARLRLNTVFCFCDILKRKLL